VRLRGERDLLSASEGPSRPRAVPGRGAASAVLVVAAAVLWGTTGTGQALLPPTEEGLRAVVVGLARLALGGAGLALLALLGPSDRWRTLRDRAAARAALVGTLAVVAYHGAFFAGVARLGVALGTVLALGIAPLTAGLGVALLGRQRPSMTWVLATATAVVGVALLLAPSGTSGPAPFGVVLSLAAGMSYATYALASKRLLDLGVDGGVAMAVLFGGGGLIALLGLAPPGARTLLAEVVSAPNGPVILVWLGLVTVVLSYRLYARGLAGLEADRATTLTLAEPVTAALLGVVLLGERLSGTALLGATLVIVGLLVTVVSVAARPRSATPRPPGAARPSGGA
jgi:DME family drug/metabolite transporter